MPLETYLQTSAACAVVSSLCGGLQAPADTVIRVSVEWLVPSIPHRQEEQKADRKNTNKNKALPLRGTGEMMGRKKNKG